VVHGDAPKRPKKNNELKLFMYNTARMKIFISQNRKIKDRDLSQKLGISFNQLQELKQFCKLNKMLVNQ